MSLPGATLHRDALSLLDELPAFARALGPPTGLDNRSSGTGRLCPVHSSLRALYGIISLYTPAAVVVRVSNLRRSRTVAMASVGVLIVRVHFSVRLTTSLIGALPWNLSHSQTSSPGSR